MFPIQPLPSLKEMLIFEKVSWAHFEVTHEAPQDLCEFTVCKLAHAASKSSDQ